MADRGIVRRFRQGLTLGQASGHALHSVVHIGLSTGKPNVAHKDVTDGDFARTGADFK